MDHPPTPPSRGRMANGASGGRRLRQLLHKENDEVIRSHTLMTVKLAETACDFFQKMAQAEEVYIQQLINIVKTFRRKTAELKREREWLPSMFGFWDNVLNEVEKTANECGSYAGELSSLVAPNLSDLTQKKKAQIKRLFTAKDQLSARLDKVEDQAHKSYKDYQEKWTKFTAPEDQSQLKGSQILQCYNAHNSYLFAIQAYNSRCEAQYKTTLPELLDDVQDLQNEVVNGLKAAFKQHLDSNHGRLEAAQKRCAILCQSVEQVNCDSDVSEFVTATSKTDEFWPPLIVYATPEQSERCFDDRLLVKTLTQAPLIHLQETLTEDEQKMREMIEKDEKELASLIGLHQSYAETPSYGDCTAVESQVVELKVRLRTKRLDLAAISGKLSLYQRVNVSATLSDTLPSNGPDLHNGRGRKGRPPSLVAGQEHDWVLLQYKLPVPCGYCGGLLKEVHKQGLKCRECKMSIHHKCKKHVPFCSGIREIDRGTLARPRGSSVSVVSHGQVKEKRFSVTGLPGSYEAPKWMTNIDEYSPPVPPRRSSAAPASQMAVSDTPPPLPLRTVSKHSDPIGIYEERISPPGWKPRSPPPTSGPHRCVALYEYYASSDGDLALSPGDVIDLVSTGESGWWQGTCHGETGFFPASYAQMLAPGDVIMRVLYDFSAEDRAELSLYEGQIVVMREKRGDGWMFGRSGNEQGLFPSSYVELLKDR